MELYKLQLSFTDLKQLIDFYTSELQKSQKKTMATITSMGLKRQVVPNPDNSITVTWYFRNFTKYNKFAIAYLSYTYIGNLSIL